MAEEHWIGWLIDDFADRSNEVYVYLQEAIVKRNIPMYGNRNKKGSVEIKPGTTDMWWRNDTPQISVTSELDGTVRAHIVVQDYGNSLWVAVRLERDERDNWAKSMAWSAFQSTLDRVIREAIREVAGEHKITDVPSPAAF